MDMPECQNRSLKSFIRYTPCPAATTKIFYTHADMLPSLTLRGSYRFSTHISRSSNQFMFFDENLIQNIVVSHHYRVNICEFEIDSSVCKVKDISNVKYDIHEGELHREQEQDRMKDKYLCPISKVLVDLEMLIDVLERQKLRKKYMENMVHV